VCCLIDYLIVGSGPSSWAASIACIEKGITPTLIDADNILDETKFSKIENDYKEAMERNVQSRFTNGLDFKKKYFLSEIPYPTQSSKIYDIDLIDSIYSRSSGGFSLVWGNALLPFRTHDMLARNWSHEELIYPDEYLKILCNIGGAALNIDFFDFAVDPQISQLNLFSNSKINIDRWGRSMKIGASSLSIDTKSCVSCGKCLEGCLFGSLLETRTKFLDLILSKKIKYIPNLVVKKFKNHGDRVIVECKDSLGKKHSLEANNLLIGAGAMSSSILTAISTGVDKLEISDSQAATFPLIRLNRSTHSFYNNIELSDLFSQSFDKSGTLTSHVQIYPASRVTNEFYKKFFIPTRIIKYMSVGHIFFDPQKSGKIEIKGEIANEVEGVQVVYKHRLLDKFSNMIKFISFFSFLIKNGVIPIPIIKFSKIGHSFHIGSTRGLIENKEHSINQIISKNFRSVLVVDGAAIPHLPPGPPTLSIMTFSYKLTKKFIEDNLKLKN